MKSLGNSVGLLVSLTCLLGVASRSEAQAPPTGPLSSLAQDPAYAAYFGPVERATAAALDAVANDGGCECTPLGIRLSDLITAAGVAGQRPSLAVIQQIASAFRGIAPEEMSAIRFASNEFASDQRDQIRSRLEAVRKGEQGFALNGFMPSGTVAHHAVRPRSILFGAAAADTLPTGFSRWGGFLNATYTHGERDPTQLEDAFTLTGTDASAGVDYRISYHGVLGVMVSHADRTLKFASTNGSTDSGIDSKGYSAVLYASYEWDGPYLSASLGKQQLANNFRRAVHFDIPTPADVITTGWTDSNAFTATIDGGWMKQNGAFGYEPLLRGLYRKTTFDAFTESSIDTSTGLPSGLGLAFAEQSIESLNASLGMKINYAFKPRFGALVSYLQAEYRHEFNDDPVQTSATFADVIAAGVTASTSTLSIESEKPDSSYYVVDAGIAATFKKGVQGYMNARSLFGLADTKLYIASLGIRGEF